MSNTAFMRLTGKTVEQKRIIILCKLMEKLNNIYYDFDEKEEKESAVKIRNSYNVNSDDFNAEDMSSDIDNMYNSIFNVINQQKIAIKDMTSKIKELEELPSIGDIYKELIRKLKTRRDDFQIRLDDYYKQLDDYHKQLGDLKQLFKRDCIDRYYDSNNDLAHDNVDTSAYNDSEVKSNSTVDKNIHVDNKGSQNKIDNAPHQYLCDIAFVIIMLLIVCMGISALYMLI